MNNLIKSRKNKQTKNKKQFLNNQPRCSFKELKNKNITTRAKTLSTTTKKTWAQKTKRKNIMDKIIIIVNKVSSKSSSQGRSLPNN